MGYEIKIEYILLDTNVKELNKLVAYLTYHHKIEHDELLHELCNLNKLDDVAMYLSIEQYIISEAPFNKKICHKLIYANIGHPPQIIAIEDLGYPIYAVFSETWNKLERLV